MQPDNLGAKPAHDHSLSDGADDSGYLGIPGRPLSADHVNVTLDRCRVLVNKVRDEMYRLERSKGALAVYSAAQLRDAVYPLEAHFDELQALAGSPVRPYRARMGSGETVDSVCVTPPETERENILYRRIDELHQCWDSALEDGARANGGQAALANELDAALRVNASLRKQIVSWRIAARTARNAAGHRH